MTNVDKFSKPETFTSLDSWILSRLSLMIFKINEGFTTRNFHKAVAAMKQFFYREFCDIYLEGTKWGFKSEEDFMIRSHTYTLIKCLEVSLRAFAPISPFLSDELYTRLAKKLPSFLAVSSLLEAPYPTWNEFQLFRNELLEERMQSVLNLITDIRCFTAHINKKLEPEVHIVTDNSEDYKFYTLNINSIKGVSRIYNITVYLKDNYIKKSNSIHNELNSNCSLFLSAKVCYDKLN